MKNEEKNYELIKYEDGDFCINVAILPSENTIWLSLEEIALLFERDRSVIGKHIRGIYSDNELKKDRTWAKNARILPDGRTYSVDIYNLDIILAVGYRVKSRRLLKFHNWANDIISKFKLKNGSTKQLITFNYDEISLDVTVSPDEDTVWLSAQQMSILFERDYKTILKHIKNVFDEGELEQDSNSQKMRLTNNKPIILYSLNVIISVGYRVKSQRGVKFRQWAISVLKEYLLTGHVVNEERCLACTSNIISLENKFNKIKNEVNEIKNIVYPSNNQLFFEGQIVESYSFIRKIFFLAKKELIIIDNYADNFLLAMLKDIKVEITIITAVNSYINKEALQNNIKVINCDNDSIHGRYIIADNYVYLIDNSFNNIGKKRFIVVKLDDVKKEYILKDIY